jgi:hypothetical protein
VAGGPFVTLNPFAFGYRLAGKCEDVRHHFLSNRRWVVDMGIVVRIAGNTNTPRNKEEADIANVKVNDTHI